MMQHFTFAKALTFSLAVAISVMSPLAPAAEPTRIPLIQGLTVVGAVQLARGDEEQIMTITADEPAFIAFSVEFRSANNGKEESTIKTRRVRREDFAASNRANFIFQDGDAAVFPGATLSHLSAASLNQLKTEGKVALVIGTIANYGEAGASMGFMDVTAGRKYFRGTLERVGAVSVPLNVLVNGVATVLQAIHGKGTFSVGDERIDIALWVLDDAANPMLLKSQQGRSQGQAVRINFPTKQTSVAVLQQALSSGSCRARLEGIYFDFASATVLAQSSPALRAVAEMMTANPKWTLRIEGHTDNVGGDVFNLDLSTRRANAVRDALVAQHKIVATRLASSGLGASRPIAKNDTLDGRAANRRVELSRVCS
jgi:outer membrane protein OmpA-like peptidoglycan-associated protein